MVEEGQPGAGLRAAERRRARPSGCPICGASPSFSTSIPRRHSRLHGAGLRDPGLVGCLRERGASCSASAPIRQRRTRGSSGSTDLPFTLLADPGHGSPRPTASGSRRHGRQEVHGHRALDGRDRARRNRRAVFRRVKPDRARRSGAGRARLAFPASETALLLAAAALAAVCFTGASQAAPSRLVEVVVTLDAPPLAEAIQQSRVLSARRRPLAWTSARRRASATCARWTSAQRTLAARIVRTIPGARITWRYRVVLDGLAVLLPQRELGRLASIPGVAKVWPNVTYRPLLDRSPQLIGANMLWGPDFTTAGNGIKIGIVDDGIDQAHPFFNPTGYTMPAGFPKGDPAFTTAKVIVARAFSPPTNTWKYARPRSTREQSEHATARGRNRGRRPLHRCDRRARAVVRSGPGRLSRQLQGAHRADRELRARTATHRRSPPASRRRCRTAWT